MDDQGPTAHSVAAVVVRAPTEAGVNITVVVAIDVTAADSTAPVLLGVRVLLVQPLT